MKLSNSNFFLASNILKHATQTIYMLRQTSKLPPIFDLILYHKKALYNKSTGIPNTQYSEFVGVTWKERVQCKMCI